MSVSLLPSGRWRAQVWDTKTARSLSVSLILGDEYASFRTRKQAEAAREKARKALRANPDMDFKRQPTAVKWHLAAKGEFECRNCRAEALLLHHIIPRVRSRMGRDDAERNGLPLCHPCHRQWHSRVLDISHEIFTDVEFAFAVYHAGATWVERAYPGIFTSAVKRAQNVRAAA